METTLSKLQKICEKQEKQIIRLQESLEHQKEEKRNAQKQLKYYKDNLEKIVEKAVNKAVLDVTKKYEKIIEEKDKRIFELEKRLNINSETSSLPSSKDPIYKPKKEIFNSREKSDKPIGRENGHKKVKLKKFEDDEITDIIEVKKDECPKCHSKDLIAIQRKQRDEIEIEIHVHFNRYNFYNYKCNNCGTIVKSEIPNHLHAENQYGSNVKTMITTLYNYGFVSYNRIRKIISGLSDGLVDPSEGYMVKIQRKAGKNLENFVFDLKEKIKKAKLVQWDDTVIRIGEKEKACLRVYTDKQLVLYKAHVAKDTKGMDEDGILQELTKDTTVVHDHLLHNYCNDYSYENAECNAHITRKLKGITVNTSHKWSAEMKQLLEDTLKKRKEKINKKVYCFTNDELDEILNKYDQIVEKGFTEYKDFKHKYEYENEENLLEFLRDYKSNITFWMKDFSIPYSNNLSETLLRMSKTKMKISYQFKSLALAEAFANIHSYTETCDKFGVNKVKALNRLFDDNPYTVDELLELKNNQEKTKS